MDAGGTDAMRGTVPGYEMSWNVIQNSLEDINHTKGPFNALEEQGAFAGTE